MVVIPSAGPAFLFLVITASKHSGERIVPSFSHGQVQRTKLFWVWSSGHMSLSFFPIRFRISNKHNNEGERKKGRGGGDPAIMSTRWIL